MKKVHLIYNPHSGRGKFKSTLRSILHHLGNHFDIELHVSHSRETAQTLARTITEQDTPQTILVAGGDGTINDVVNGAKVQNLRLGIIPVGSVNVIAYDLKIPSNIKKACEIIKNNDTTAPLDICKANGYRFIFGAGAGFDAVVIENVGLEHKLLFGKMIYAWHSLRFLLTFKAFSGKIVCDGVELYNGKIFDVIVGQSNYYAGRFKLFDDASYTNDKMNCVVFTHDSLGGYIKGFLSFFCQIRDKQRIYFSGKRIEIITDQPVPFHTDGDEGGVTPVTFKVSKKKLNVIVPTKFKA